jgi:hypothetical protein
MRKAPGKIFRSVKVLFSTGYWRLTLETAARELVQVSSASPKGID